MAFNLPFGVRIANDDPVDQDRYLAADNTARDALITDGRAYEGLLVYVEDPDGGGGIPSTLYMLIILGVDPGSSTWLTMANTDGVSGGEPAGTNDIQFSDAAGDFFATIEDLTTSAGFYFDIALSGTLAYGFGTRPQTANGFSVGNRNIQIKNTDNSAVMNELVFEKSRHDGATNQPVQIGDLLSSIASSGNTATGGQYRSSFDMEAVVAVAPTVGNTIKSDLVLYYGQASSSGDRTERFRFRWDGSMKAGNLPSGPDSNTVLAINGSGEVVTSSKLVSDIGAGAGALTNAYTSVKLGGTTVTSSGASQIEFFEGSSKVNLTLSGASDADVTVDIVESNIIHDNLSGFVGNEHVNHSTVSINSGTGLTGGGAITTSQTLSLDTGSARNVSHSLVSIITGSTSGLNGGGDLTASRTLLFQLNRLTSTSIVDRANDYVAIYDASAGQTRRALISEFQGDTLWDGSHITYSGVWGGFRFRKDSKGMVYYIGRITSGSTSYGITVDPKFRPSTAYETQTPLTGVIFVSGTPDFASNVSAYMDFEIATTRLRLTQTTIGTQQLAGCYPSNTAF